MANGRLKARYLANKNVAFDVCESGYCELEPRWVSDPFYPRFWQSRLNEPLYGNPKGIFVCDMSELFGPWLPYGWTNEVFHTINRSPQHRFYLLTKQQQEMVLLSPFPPNCWVGATATNHQQFIAALRGLRDIEATVRFLSIEPYLEPILLPLMSIMGEVIDWIIIGACTGKKKEMEALCQRNPSLTLLQWGKKWTAQPRIEWVQEIVRAADRAGVKVFLKNNLLPMYQAEWAKKYDKEIWDDAELRQEMPGATQ